MNRLTTRLNLESLNDRIVPAIVNLTAAGASATVAGAIVTQIDAATNDTQTITPFVRLDADTREHGYNTDWRPLQFDERPNTAVTHSLQLDDVPVVTIDDVRYREFHLDIRQDRTSPRLSLDEVRVYLADVGNLHQYNRTAQTLGGQTAIYNLDSGGDVSVTLNANLNRTRGRGDMTLLVPESAFGTVPAEKYVYLYSRFGGVAGHRSNGGFEEWAVRGNGGFGGTDTPPPSGNSLAGTVFFDSVISDGAQGEGEDGIAGVTITLAQYNNVSEMYEFVAEVQTDENGNFSFTGLADGKYSIVEAQPFEYSNGTTTAPEGGGVVNGDEITEIVLLGGVSITGYTFAENVLDG
jgi:hypothetical protein